MEGVYAIGDVIKGIQLAHVASAQGVWVAEHLAGTGHSIDLSVVPSCVYTSPEIASVGLTEDEAAQAGIPVSVGKFLMSANGKSQISREERGFIKIIAEADTKVVLGAHSCFWECAPIPPTMRQWERRWRSLKAAASTRFPDRLRASLRADSNQENRMSGGISLWQSSVHLTY